MTCFRTSNVQRLVTIVLIALVAMSSQAWASHVDWPAMQTDGAHAHVDISALDDAQSVDDSRSAQPDHSDHCGHSAAHLTGLRSHAADMDFEIRTRHARGHRSRYETIAHPPLIFPPIV